MERSDEQTFTQIRSRNRHTNWCYMTTQTVASSFKEISKPNGLRENLSKTIERNARFWMEFTCWHNVFMEFPSKIDARTIARMARARIDGSFVVVRIPKSSVNIFAFLQAIDVQLNFQSLTRFFAVAHFAANSMEFNRFLAH